MIPILSCLFLGMAKASDIETPWIPVVLLVAVQTEIPLLNPKITLEEIGKAIQAKWQSLGTTDNDRVQLGCFALDAPEYLANDCDRLEIHLQKRLEDLRLVVPVESLCIFAIYDAVPHDAFSLPFDGSRAPRSVITDSDISQEEDMFATLGPLEHAYFLRRKRSWLAAFQKAIGLPKP